MRVLAETGGFEPPIRL